MHYADAMIRDVVILQLDAARNDGALLRYEHTMSSRGGHVRVDMLRGSAAARA